MPKKQKFNPEITRVKLNPEQAVLACSCYGTARHMFDTPHYYGHFPGRDEHNACWASHLSPRSQTSGWGCHSDKPIPPQVSHSGYTYKPSDSAS